MASALLVGVIGFAATSPAVTSNAHAVEPYFCIELVLSRNWLAAQFYCDAASMPDNTGVVLAEGIAYFFGAQDAGDVAHAGRLWRSLPPLADAGEWRNVAGVYDAEVDIIEREAATLNRLAQYKLAVLHETGHLTTADPPVAVFRYQQAANAGLPEAHIALARLFQHGVGVDADPVTAQQHLLAAIEERPALRLPARPAPSEAVAEASPAAEPVPTRVSGSGEGDGGGGILAAITGQAENTQSVVETNDTQTVNTRIAAIDPDLPEAELDALETSVVTGQLRRRTIVGAAMEDQSRDGADNDVAQTAETAVAAAASGDNDASGTDNNTGTDAGIGVGILAGLLGTDDTQAESEAEPEGQAIVQLWESGSGVAIVPPEASAGAADVVDPNMDPGAAVAETDTEEAGSRWAPPAEVAALYYPKEPLEGISSELAPPSPSGSATSGQTASGGDAVSVTTGRLDTRQTDDRLHAADLFRSR